MSRPKVLVIGGRGFFGRLLVEDLLQHGGCDLIVASRRHVQTDGWSTAVVDLLNRPSLERALNGIDIAICAAGPYQELPVTLAELCIERGIHYIDLADDRGFVRKVSAMAAGHGGVDTAICPAWSTVSALSGMLAQIASSGMTTVDSIHIHMAPGNRGARQTATIASLLFSAGRPLLIFRDGQWSTVRGWSGPSTFAFAPPIGKRRGYLIDVPDHELFPALFGARTVEFRAGSELRILNGAVSLSAALRCNWPAWRGFYQKAAALFSWLGHDWGAIGVEVAGRVSAGGSFLQRKRTASVIAESNGQRIAVMPASAMTNLLVSGVRYRGLVRHNAWITEAQLRRECEKREFRFVLEGD